MTRIERRAQGVAATGLALVLAVVLLSAAIRLGQAAAPPLEAGTLFALRGLHRASASLEVLAAAWLGWFAWRSRLQRPMLARGVMLAVALTLGLSVLGILAGREPPPLAAAGNLLGGLALAAVFAWLLGMLHARAVPVAGCAFGIGGALVAAQCLLGARLTLLPATAASVALPSHAMLGILLACAAAWFARRCAHAGRRRAGFALALLVPLAGFTALQYENSAIAAFVHAAAAALLVVVAAYTPRLRGA